MKIAKRTVPLQYTVCVCLPSLKDLKARFTSAIIVANDNAFTEKEYANSVCDVVPSFRGCG